MAPAIEFVCGKEFDYTLYAFTRSSAQSGAASLDIGINDDLNVVRFHAKEQTEGRTFRWSQRQSFIIVNGIRFTGMPGWGGEDEENWKLVLFIRHLPQLSERELELMKEVNGQEL